MIHEEQFKKSLGKLKEAIDELGKIAKENGADSLTVQTDSMKAYLFDLKALQLEVFDRVVEGFKNGTPKAQ